MTRFDAAAKAHGKYLQSGGVPSILQHNVFLRHYSRALRVALRCLVWLITAVCQLGIVLRFVPWSLDILGLDHILHLGVVALLLQYSDDLYKITRSAKYYCAQARRCFNCCKTKRHIIIWSLNEYWKI